MGNCTSNPDVTDAITQRSQNFIDERVGKIPSKYQREKDHIVYNMRKKSPGDYHGLYIKDYPHTNEKQVNQLTILNITSNEVKHKIIEEVHGEIDPIIDEQTASMNKIAQTTTKKATDIMIKKTVSAAVDGIRRQLEQKNGINSKENQKKSKN